MSWTSGYISEVEYTHGYYRELSPGQLRLACLNAGVSPPALNRINYLELGFGQGLSLNIHAAATDGEFWGTDFNPNQVAQARALNDASGSGAKLFDDLFAEFAARSDLPEFDIIGLHGIWTWISDDNRRTIVDLIRRKLRVGGMTYISYNCLPGWAPAMPLRHLMKLHAEFTGANASGLLGKVDDALKFTKQVVDSGALYFKANPAVAERLKTLTEQNRNYLAHEYFNLDWDIMTFSDVARMLSEAKLSFVASAHLMDHVEVVNLSEAGQKLLAGIHEPILRQSVRDYFVNQQFRRDVFIKGSQRLSEFERSEMLRQQPIMLVTPIKDISMKVMGSLGEATLHEPVYRPIIEIMAEDGYAVKTIGQLAANPKLSAVTFASLVQAVFVLAGAGHLHPAQEPSQQAKSRCAALNKFICERARSSSNISYLASPMTAIGIGVSRIEQLFILASEHGRKTPKEHATYVWDLLSVQGQGLIKDGKTLQTAEENSEELLRQAIEYFDKRLPILKALGVA